MKLKDGRINIFVNAEYTTIEIIDNNAHTTFATIKLTSEQLCTALSRQARVECDIDVYNIDRVGKKMIHKQHEFEIPFSIDYNNKNQMLSELIKDTLPEGWISDNHFSSQNTFFEKDGKKYARTTIRSYVEEILPNEAKTNL